MPLLDTRFAYLIGDLVPIAIWLLLFILRKDLRRPILLMSILIAPLGPLSEVWYFRDYWHPQTFNGLTLSFEDLIFSFTLGGISTVIYEEVMRRRFINLRKQSQYYALLLFPITVIMTLLVLSDALRINSIYASILAFVGISVFMLRIRPELAKSAILSAMLLATIAVAVYLIWSNVFPGIFQKWWEIASISGLKFLNIPVEEIAWFFSWGLVAGPLYEFITGRGDRKFRSS